MAFEDRTLPFDQWTHEAHLRMAWNYIKEHGKEKAIPLIRFDVFQVFTFCGIPSVLLCW